ncbi:uncharacterized protein N7459_004291 [Penicillium hispanicum]|uniref:uncharacterized protein n=1 Tax=Penicillium hispanicum TaxID=1080232 RepID=UPI002541DFB7|nr:uncharacterized protein N7459_004291 [Penicillium hispanicum]KAJ5584491.1 hypothetical protein N7459_004291 [Penicillium hispanicum]
MERFGGNRTQSLDTCKHVLVHGAVSNLPLFQHEPTDSKPPAQAHRSSTCQHLRVITPDRNGYGLTTFDSRRVILDWPADVQVLAHNLDIKRFAVLGGSGGSPYALACAYLLPKEIISAVGIMAGAGP